MNAKLLSDRVSISEKSSGKCAPASSLLTSCSCRSEPYARIGAIIQSSTAWPIWSSTAVYTFMLRVHMCVGTALRHPAGLSHCSFQN